MAADRIALVPEWEAKVLENEAQIFPPLPVMPGASLIDDGLRAGLGSFAEKPSKRPKTEAAVRIRNPDDDAGTDTEESEEDPGLPAVALQHMEGEEGGPPEVPVEVEERPSRIHRFGPWTLSEVWDQKRGVQVGWGGNCNRHFDCTGLPCKKNFKYATDSPEECRRRVKQWLLMGSAIACGHHRGRALHVKGIDRDSIALRDEAELDAEAEALV